MLARKVTKGKTLAAASVETKVASAMTRAWREAAVEEVDLEAVAAVVDGRAIMSPGVLRHRAAMGLERLLTKKMGFEMTVLRRRRGSRSRSRRGDFLRSLDQHQGDFLRSLDQHQHPVGRHLPLEDTDS